MTDPRRRETITWTVVVAVVLAGVITTIVGLLTPASFGWSAYQPLADATFRPGGESVVLSRTTAVGLTVLTLGLLALAFLSGWRLAKRTPLR